MKLPRFLCGLRLCYLDGPKSFPTALFRVEGLGLIATIRPVRQSIVLFLHRGQLSKSKPENLCCVFAKAQAPLTRAHAHSCKKDEASTPALSLKCTTKLLNHRFKGMLLLEITGLRTEPTKFVGADEIRLLITFMKASAISLNPTPHFKP